MKKNYLFIIAIILIIIGIFLLRFVFWGSEDSWIKDSRGIYVKHGNPSETPNYVLEQQETLNCALNKFDSFNEEINSQCLGICGDYAIDIIHVPRTSEDDLIENQCEDYRNGNIGHFIELNRDGGVVRIV